MTLRPTNANPASWRDPAGFIFSSGGEFFRQVSKRYQTHYDALISSGLYENLVARGLLLPHEDVEPELALERGAYKILRPRQLELVSYPYEWCFSQLRAAALTTLEIQQIALQHGMTLKDASAYNIQFVAGKPVLIDTLSFECYEEGKPWIAYHQFCRHFLAPLALAARVDIRLLDLLRANLDGIPLDYASALLPRRTWLRFGLLTHLHLHARSVRSFADGKSAAKNREVSVNALRAVVDNLRQAVAKLHYRQRGTEWGDYYDTHNYSEDSFQHKQEVVAEMLKQIQPDTVWDLGANTGVFSKLATATGASTVAWDIDPVAVENNFQECCREGESRILPLRLDLTNPSPALGWAHQERMSLQQRGPVDLILALALVHHLAIGNNVQLPMIIEWFAGLGRHVIVEFVPKDDPQVQRLLASREDIFADYNEESFREACEQHFCIEKQIRLRESGRTIFQLQRRGD